MSTRCGRPHTNRARTPPGRCTSQRGCTPGAASLAPGRAATSSTACSRTRRPVAVGGGAGDPGARTNCSRNGPPAGSRRELASGGGQGVLHPAQVRPQRQRPAVDLEVQLAQPAVHHRVGRAEHRGPQGQLARCSRRVVEGLPATVRGPRLGPVGAQPGERGSDQVGSRVGHPAEEDEAELTPGQTLHLASLSRSVSVSKHTPGVSPQIDRRGLSRPHNAPMVDRGPTGTSVTLPGDDRPDRRRTPRPAHSRRARGPGTHRSTGVKHPAARLGPLVPGVFPPEPVS